MEWSIEEYREDYIRKIQIESKSEATHENNIFIERLRDILVNDQSIISDITPMFVPETMNIGNKFKKMALHAGSVEEFANSINLLYCDYNENDPTKITKAFVLEKAKLLVSFVENTLKGYFNQGEITSDIFQFAQDIKNVINIEKTVNKLQLFFISTNYLSERFPPNIVLEEFEYQGVKLEVKIMVIGFEEIYKNASKEFVREDLVIKTSDFGCKGIPCMKAEVDSNKYDAYLAIVPGTFLANIYDKYPQRILEQNVRSFLNVRGKINKGIRGTLWNEKENFFIYNNGITTTAKDVTTEIVDGVLMITSFTELQIVNGGQTTASLSSVVIKDKRSIDGVFVQMKLTVSPEKDQNFIRTISKFANSQNAVKQSDLASNDAFFIRISELSSKIFAPVNSASVKTTKWFFERTRGSYEQPMMSMTKAERTKYELENPKSQKFTKGDLAKWVNCDELRPYDVSWGPEVNLERFQDKLKDQWEKENTSFNEYYFKTLIGKGILFKKIGEVISKQQWYIENRAHRDKIVPYTFSKMVFEYEKLALYINYLEIWQKQEVPAIFEKDIETVSKIIFDVLNDPLRPVANTAEYAKRKACWDEVQKRKFKASEEAVNILITKEKIKDDGRFAKKDRILDNSIDALISIFNYGEKNWGALKEKAVEQSLIGYYEETLLDLAISYCKSGKGLMDRKAKEIWKLKEKIESFGLFI